MSLSVSMSLAAVGVDQQQHTADGGRTTWDWPRRSMSCYGPLPATPRGECLLSVEPDTLEATQ